MFVTPDKISQLGNKRCRGTIVIYLSPHMNEADESSRKLILKEVHARFGEKVNVVAVGDNFYQAVYAVF